MSPRNIIIFGDPSIDRRFLLKLFGISVTWNANDLPPFTSKVFQTQAHSVTIGRNHYKLYNTVGLHSDVSSLEPHEVLSSLYHFTHAFVGGINLLIYVVGDSHSVNNIKLFHDYLCRRDVLIILVTSNPRSPSTSYLESDNLAHFKVVLTLNGSNLESDRANLREAVSRHIRKRDPKDILPIARFEVTAIKSWKLLERAAGWSIPKWLEALKATLMEDAFFSEQDAAAKCQHVAEYIKKHYFRNVIVFGDTGAGKTSVVKMLTDKVEVDPTKAASAGGSTFESKAYEVDINEYPYVLHDTVGLEDGTSISMSPQEALKSLYQLILKVEGGVSLLVYVHRGKITPSQIENYKLFTHVICKSMIPTALVVTGLEEVESREVWWQANKGLYDKQEISTKHHACITSTQGKFSHRHKEFVYQDQYDESKIILKDLFLNAALLNPRQIASTPNRWKTLVAEVSNIVAVKFKWQHLVANRSLYHDFLGIGMDEDQAKSWANNMDRVRVTRTSKHSSSTS